MDYVAELLDKDYLCLKSNLSIKQHEFISQRFRENLFIKQSIENSLKEINDEMDAIKHGTKILNFANINIPSIFVDEFGEI